jgi:glycosyltransferase involved in cell wall biosynthesis
VRILYLADIRFPLERANGIQTMETCHALAERGHRVTLLVRPDTTSPPRDPFAFYDLPPVDRLEIRRAPVRGPLSMRRLLYLGHALAAATERCPSDVVVTRDLGVAAMLLRLPRSRRPPIVYESHGLAPVFGDLLPVVVSGAPRASRWKRRRLLGRERWVWRRAEGYVTITSALAAELERRFGPRARVATIPDGVRLDPHRRFALPEPRVPPVVLYVGHLYPWKGVDVLLAALAELPGVRGVIAGGHPAELDLPRARALAEALGLAGRVTFTGWIPRAEVPALLASGDVLVLPNTPTAISERYTSPLKLFEYMAAGRPIVASDLPALREVLRDGETACLVAPGDAKALAGAIRRVLGDRAFAERLARGAFEAAAAYAWSVRAERLERLLAEVVEAR